VEEINTLTNENTQLKEESKRKARRIEQLEQELEVYKQQAEENCELQDKSISNSSSDKWWST
jgi:hypothetical protein